MKLLNIIIYSIGIFTLIVSWIQWFFRFPDTSQLILGSSIGVIFLAFGYIYSWMIKINEELSKLESKVDGIIKIYNKGEWE